jgi:hypothetical protein
MYEESRPKAGHYYRLEWAGFIAAVLHDAGTDVSFAGPFASRAGAPVQFGGGAAHPAALAMAEPTPPPPLAPEASAKFAVAETP